MNNSKTAKIVFGVLTFAPLFAFLFWIHLTEKRSPEDLVRIRQSLFTSVSDRIEEFSKPPSEWHQASFRQDPPDLVDSYKSLILKLAPDVVNSVALSRITAMDSKIEQAKQLILLFSHDNGAECGINLPLIDTIKRLATPGIGSGCCSDHTEVFLAFAAFVGITAREVHSTVHTTVEIFAPSIGSWVWFDPQFAIHAKDKESGKPLSGLDIRDLYLTNQRPEFFCFGNSSHDCTRKDVSQLEPYLKDKFLFDFGITLGNNVFEQDKFSNSVSFFSSQALRQIMGIAVGIVPTYLFAGDKKSEYLASLKSRRDSFLSWVTFGIGISFLNFIILIKISSKSS